MLHLYDHWKTGKKPLLLTLLCGASVVWTFHPEVYVAEVSIILYCFCDFVNLAKESLSFLFLLWALGFLLRSCFSFNKRLCPVVLPIPQTLQQVKKTKDILKKQSPSVGPKMEETLKLVALQE